MTTESRQTNTVLLNFFDKNLLVAVISNIDNVTSTVTFLIHTIFNWLICLLIVFQLVEQAQ